ncbi:MAG TPA: DEAD/DEAH box helicase [Jatrophihabitantaceae bacterium]|jgi:superfamily II DNA/RNA helicase|nr:DEAD/DEAH box helicase [Jatrophihabitantaceae bacterium]
MQVVPTENLPAFADLGLAPSLVKALSRAGIESPFPIQAATIPDVLAGRDLLGRAATGSGKTLAFGLPMIVRLEGRPSTPRRPRGLILVPTRELAMQVTDAIAPLADARGVSVRLVAGGLPIGKQINSLERGVDVLVATPGRLIDLIERRSCSLEEVEVTVLDEADHMADLGFLPVVRRLLDMTPSGGQRLLFSATLDGDVGVLVDKYLKNPAAHALHSAVASVDSMSHHLFRLDHAAKFEVISEIAARPGRSILFVRTKYGADRLARQLGAVGVAAGALHGGRSQSQRTRALTAFKDGSVPVLVATDVAARGIHVDDVSLVLHVDPPQDGKDYLHRSGRTARAGESGTVVLLTTSAEERAVRKMLGEAGVRPDQRDVAPGDQAVASITGARRPSGTAIVVRPSPAAQPGRRSSAAGGNRPTSSPRRRHQVDGGRGGSSPRGRSGH